MCQPFDSEGRTICIADAHRGDGKRFIVCADEKLTAFLELECHELTDSHRFADMSPELAFPVRERRRPLKTAGGL